MQRRPVVQTPLERLPWTAGLLYSVAVADGVYALSHLLPVVSDLDINTYLDVGEIFSPDNRLLSEFVDDYKL